jgi:hypothetical protein
MLIAAASGIAQKGLRLLLIDRLYAALGYERKRNNLLYTPNNQVL